jgi:HlyD family secretion protein
VSEQPITNRREPSPPEPSRNGLPSLRDRVQSLRMPANLPPARRSPWALLPWVLAIGFGIATVVLANRQAPDATDDEDKKNALKSASEGEQRDLAPGDVMLESKGYIVPIRTIQVSPKVSGMVTSLRFEEGMLVRKGYILAVLEKVEYLSDRDKCKGQVDGALSRWQEMCLSYWSQIAQAAADLDNATAIHLQEKEQLAFDERSGKSLSVQDLAKRRAQIPILEARVKWYDVQLMRMKGDCRRGKGELERKIWNAKAELDQYQADLVKAQWRLDNCEIEAPVTGIILVKRAEEGNMVNPSAFSNGLSASLCDMADLTELEVDLSIPERDVARLIEFKRKNEHPQKCVVRADAFPNQPYDGYLSRIMPQGDRAKGAVPVRVKIIIPLSQAGVYLRPEMSAGVTFLNAHYVVKPERRFRWEKQQEARETNGG